MINDTVSMVIPLSLTLHINLTRDGDKWSGRCDIRQAVQQQPPAGCSTQGDQLVLPFPDVPRETMPVNCSECQDKWDQHKAPNSLAQDGFCQRSQRALAYGDLYIGPPAWCLRREML